MPQKMPGDGRSEEGSSERQLHHISSIAHLFFTEDESAAAEVSVRETHEFVVTCFNDSRISAFACAGLAAGVGNLVDEGALWGVRLREGPGVSWSALPFIPANSRGDQANRSSGRAENPRGIWHRPGVKSEAGAWVQWTHEAADDLGPGSGLTLVVCLLARELAQWEMAFNLGRLLGCVQPQRLEVLVFPDTWAPDAKSEWGLRFWQDRGGVQDRDLLGQCHNLTRAIGGVCPVTITALPKGVSEDGDRSCGAILQKISLRLTSDLCPPSFG